MVSRTWVVLLVCAVMGAGAEAATLTWDPGNTANGVTIDPASGTWDVSATVWNNAGVDVAWTQTNATTPLNAAVFAGPDGAYAINVGASIAAQSLTFNASGYVLSATSPQQIFVPSGAPVSVLAGKLMTVGNNVTITSGGSTYTVQPNASNVGGGTLLIESGGVVQATGAGTLGISGPGSTVTVNAGGTLRQTGNGVISVGQPRASGVGATLNVLGGTVSVAGGNLQIANALSTGTLAGPAVGTLNLNAGTVTIGLGGALLLNTGTTTATNFASATANINGGSLTTGTGGVIFGTATTPDATGVVNLNGGTLTTNRFVRTNGSATVNFNGGTLRASASNGTFMQGLDAANVKSGGAVIDTNGFNVTIAQPLLDGGGGGGLTKNGAGALQLIGSNTYVGPTAVNAGALYVDASLAASPVSVANGATFGGVGTVAGTVTLASGGHVGGGTANTAGNLTVGGLTLNAGALLDHEVGDLVTVTDPGGLTLNGGKVNLFSTFAAGPLTTPGTYTLIDYNGSFAGSVASLGVGNPIAGKLYTFQNDAANTAITLTVADAASTEWTGLAGDGLWPTAGNWSGGVPNSAGITARFGTTPPGATVVQVSGPKTVGVLTFDNASGYTINGAAADVITLNSASSTPAGILANSGNHTINAPLALASDLGAIIASGSTVTIGGNVTGATKNLTVNGGGTLVLLGTDSYAATSIAAATLQVGNGGTTGNLGTGPVTLGPGGRLVMKRSDEARLESGVVGAEGMVVQEGTGTLVLSNVNTFGTAGAGGLQVLGGTVQLGSATGLPAGVLVTVDNEATFDLHGFNATLGSLLVDAGTVTDTSSTAGTSTLTVNQAGNTTFTGGLLDGPSRKIALTKQGAGTLTLDGTVANTYSGLTTVTGGTLSLAKIGGAPAIVGDVAIGDASGSDILQLGAADQIADTSVISFTAGASGSSAFFRLKGNNETVRGLTTTVAAAAVVENDGPAGTATLTVDTAGNDYTYDGIFRDRSTAGNTGLFALTKAGAGTLTLANTVKVVATSYTGATTITGGRLVLDNLDAFSSSITNNSPAPDGLTFNQTTRNLSLGAGAVISGSGGVTKTGPGTLTLLSTSNSYSGNTVIVAGTLAPGGSGAIPSGLGKGNVVLDGGASAAGTLNLNGFSVDINGLAGTAGAVVGQVVNNGAAPATLNVGNGDASATFSGVIRDNAGTGSILGVTKTGTGVQTLAGANTYSDATIVNNGTLRVSGSIAGSSGVNVNGGGTFEAAASQTVKGVSVQPGGVVKVTAAPAAARTVLKIGDNVNPAPLTIAAGVVDLVSNAIAVDVPDGSEALTLGVVRLLVIGGYNATPAGAGNGKWDGTGIVSSTAAGPGGGNKGVGYALASEVPLGAGNTFLGTGVDGSSVLARYTLLGDATLDGVVDFNDLVKLAQNYNTTVSATTDSWWFNGDFTYDGIVDFNDLVKLAQNYNSALPSEAVPGAPAGFDGELAAAMAAVPEPSAIAGLGVVAAAMVARGRRARAR